MLFDEKHPHLVGVIFRVVLVDKLQVGLKHLLSSSMFLYSRHVQTCQQ